MNIRRLFCLLIALFAFSIDAVENRHSSSGINFSWFNNTRVDAYDDQCVKEERTIQCHIRGIYHMLMEYEKLIGELTQLDLSDKQQDIQRVVKQACPVAVRDFPRSQSNLDASFKKALDIVFLARAGTCHLAKELANEKNSETIPSLLSLREKVGGLATCFAKMNLLYPNFASDPLL